MGPGTLGFLTQEDVFPRAKCPLAESYQAWELRELGLVGYLTPVTLGIYLPFALCVLKRGMVPEAQAASGDLSIAIWPCSELMSSLAIGEMLRVPQLKGSG